jgi:hypothetical protein
MDPKDDLDVVKKKRLIAPCRKSNPDQPAPPVGMLTKLQETKLLLGPAATDREFVTLSSGLIFLSFFTYM